MGLNPRELFPEIFEPQIPTLPGSPPEVAAPTLTQNEKTSMGMPAEGSRLNPRELFPELFGPPPEMPPQPVPAMRASLLPVAPFRIPKEAPQELPERGILSDIGAATLGSLRDVAEMGLRTARAISPFESAYEPTGILSKGIEALKDTDKWDIMKPSKEVATGPWYRRWIYEGIRSALPSLSTMVTGAVAGQLAIPIPGVGAAIGAAAGQALSAAPFGASEYDRFMEEAKEKGLDEGETKPYALASGMTEWMGETLGNWLGAKILRMAPGGQQLTEPLKNTIRQMFKVPLKEGAKDMVKEYINETGTEFGQNAIENWLRQKAGMPQEQTPLAEGLESIGPTLVMTSIFGLGAAGFNHVKRAKLYKSMEDNTVNIEDRQKAVNEITYGLYDQAGFKPKDIQTLFNPEVPVETRIDLRDKIVGAQKDPETARQLTDIAMQWDFMANQAVQAGQPIAIDQTIEDYFQAQVTPTEGKPSGEEKPKGKEEPAAPGPGAQPPPTQPGPGVPWAVGEEVEVEGKNYRILDPQKFDDWTNQKSRARRTKTLVKNGVLELIPAPAEAVKVVKKEGQVKPKEEKPPTSALPPQATPAPSATVEEPKPAERPRGIIPAAEVWEKTPGDAQEEWGKAVEFLDAHESGIKKRIKGIQDQLDALKGQNGKAVLDQKKTLKAQIEELKGALEEPRAAYEEVGINESLALRDEAEKRATERGLPEEQMEAFLDDFLLASSQERPYIEQNYNKPVSQIFDDVLADFMEREETYYPETDETLEERIEGLGIPPTEGITPAVIPEQRPVYREGPTPTVPLTPLDIGKERETKEPIPVPKVEKAIPPPPGEEPEAPRKYLPALMLDGKVMVGKSHVDIAPLELVKKAKDVTLGWVDSNTGEFYTDEELREKTRRERESKPKEFRISVMGEGRVPVEGKPVTLEGLEGKEFFVHPAYGGPEKFVVSESSTGMAISQGATEEEALTKARSISPEKIGEALNKTYEGISVYKAAAELTDEEFEKLMAPSPTRMEERNTDLAGFQGDPRFLVRLTPGEPGYQTTLKEYQQPVRTDFAAVREFFRSGVLPPAGQEIQNHANRLQEINPEISGPAAIKTAARVLTAIRSGAYNDSVHPNNKAARTLFREITGQKLSPGVKATQEFFTGTPLMAPQRPEARTPEALEATPAGMNEADADTLRALIKDPGSLDRKALLGRAYYEGIDSLTEKEQNKLFLSLFDNYSLPLFDAYVRGWKEIVPAPGKETSPAGMPEWFRPGNPPVEEKLPPGFPEFTRAEGYWNRSPKDIHEERQAVSDWSHDAIEERNKLIEHYKSRMTDDLTDAQRSLLQGYVTKYIRDKEGFQPGTTPFDIEMNRFMDLAWEEAKRRGVSEDRKEDFKYEIEAILELDQNETPIRELFDKVIGVYLPKGAAPEKFPFEIGQTLYSVHDKTRGPLKVWRARPNENGEIWLKDRRQRNVFLKPEELTTEEPGETTSAPGKPEAVPSTPAITRNPEADKYVKSIRNRIKRDYANAYHEWLLAGEPAGKIPPRGGLSAMAVQAVRIQLDNLYPSEALRKAKAALKAELKAKKEQGPPEPEAKAKEEELRPVPGSLEERGPAEPDLTVTGQRRPVPNRVGAEYVVHRAKPVLGDTRTYRVIMTRTEPGFLTTDGKGDTPEEAYNNALRNFDEMVGEKPSELPAAPTEEWGAKNTVFTKDRADRAREILRKKAGELRTGIDPELIQAGIDLAGYHIEAGARKFVDYARKMVEDIGDFVKPYLKSWYNAIRDYPGFDATGMDGYESIIKIDVDRIFEKPTIEAEGSEAYVERTAETGRPEEHGQRALEGVSSEDVPSPAEVRRAGEEPRPGGEEYGGGLPEREEAAPGEGVRAEPGAPGGLGTGEGGVVAPSGRGAGERPEAGEPEQPIPGPHEQPKASPVGRNFRITPEAEKTLTEGGQKTKARNNIAAIELLKKIEEEGRLATPEEQAILAKYTGWGGIPQIFNRYEREWKKDAERLNEVLTDEEYESARASTPNAHYTTPQVVRFMWNALQKMGIKGGRFLEPSMGTGIFYGLLPETLTVKLSGVELDSISGRIAKQLYQNADIRVMGYETTKFPNDFFDLVISNVPFGDYKVHDPGYNKFNVNIHDYFFLKSFDKVRPGGIVAFVTSHYTMDAKSSRVRDLISEKADLLAAVRLPETAFQGIANTEVVTDILFLHKRVEGQQAVGETWSESVEKTARDKYGNDQAYNRNVYYDSHPENLLGKETLEGTMYRAGSYTVEGKRGQNLSEDLEAVLAKLPANVVTPQTKPETKVEIASSIPAPDYVKEGAFVIVDDKIYQKEGDELKPVEVPDKQVAKTKRLIRLRDAARDLLHQEMEAQGDEGIKERMDLLNKEYEKFIKLFGPLHDPKNKKKLVFADDPDYPLVLSLEQWDDINKKAAKADIFTKRVIQPFKKITHVDTSKEALVVSLTETGQINFGRMVELTGKSEDQIKEELSGLIFRNPEGEKWETGDEYLSGNVREKLKVAESAALTDKTYQKNVESLRMVQPEDLTFDQIEARLGSTWIPPQVISQFMADVLNVPGLKVNYSPSIAMWTIEQVRNRWRLNQVENTETYGTPYFSGHELVLESLNHRVPTVRVKDEDGNTHVDTAATEAAREKQYNLKNRFKEWVWQDEERRNTLVRKYNEEMNNMRVRTFDGSHLTLPGTVPEDVLKLRPHQKDGIWRVIQSPTTLLAHVVGSGKTYTMVGAAMELRRLGISKKPMFVVPNHMVKQFASEFLQLYPSANILAASKEDFEPLKRNTLMSRISTGDWDAVIVPHTSFGKIPMSKEAVVNHLNKQLADLEAAIMELLAAGEEKKSKIIKQIEKAKKRLAAKIRDKLSEEEKTVNVTFEELGVDQLFVDEAHYFKNLLFATKMQRVAGIQGSASERASDLYIKTDFLLNKYNRGVVFATGTPISNTMAEMFTMQRYLQPKVLADHGLQHFDAWAANFGEVVSSLELAPEGGGYRVKSRFAKFTNVTELQNMFRMMADVKTADMLNLPRPEIEGGKPKEMVSPASEDLNAYIQTLMARAEHVRLGRVDPRVDNMLKITNDGRKAALDMRLIHPGMTSGPDSKVNKAADRIAEIHKAGQEGRLTQIVFCDLSTPKTGEDTYTFTEQGEKVKAFSVYDDLREKLVAMGVPKEEVAFIHEYDKAEAKQKLFDRVNSGDVRVIIGSTDKMGVGTNIQKRLVACHHLDAPWRPADIEQRDGRILRQGNDNKTVQIHYYVTEGSFDAYMWQLLENKAKFIHQAMTSDARVLEDVEGAALTYAEMKACASGNPLIKEKIHTDMEVRRLQMLRSQWAANKYHQQDQIARESHILPTINEKIEKLKQDIAARKIPEKFVITIEGKEYTDRKEAGEALQKISGKMFRESQEGKKYRRVIGNFAGFEISIDTSRKDSSSLLFGISGESGNVSESPAGTIQSLEYATGKGLDQALKTNQELARDSEQKISKLKAELEKPFDQEEKLKALIKKQEEIDKQLDLDKSEVTEGLEEEAGAEEILDEEGPKRKEEKEKEEEEPEYAVYGWSSVAGRPGVYDRYGHEVSGQTIEDIQKAVAPIINKWHLGDVVKVVQAVEDVPEGHRKPNMAAVHIRDWKKIVLVADRLRNKEDAQRRLFHEALGHYGLREMLGPKLDQFLKLVYHQIPVLDLDQIAETWDLDLTTPEGRLTAASEYMAILAERTKGRGAPPSLLQKLYAKIRQILREMGFDIELKDFEIHAALGEAARRLERGERATGEAEAGAEYGQPGLAPVFISQLRKALGQKLPNAAPVDQIKAILKSPGIKEDEVKWSGIRTWLEGKQKKISKQEVLDFLDQNQVEIREITKEEGKTKYGTWVEPGGENYRELLLTLPVPRYESLLYRIRPAGNGNYEVTRRDNGSFVGQYPNRRQAQEAILERDKRPLPYRSSHWQELNVLAHVRFDERIDIDGKRVLFLEEVQSDWHQAGRKQGYEEGGIPSAPFSKTWHELVLKRLLRYAAENDFDRLAWTTGEQQIARNSIMAMTARSVLSHKNPDGTWNLTVTDNKGAVHDFVDIAEQELTDVLGPKGKDLADRILATEGKETTFSDLDVKIGREGMTGFYDEILPEFLNKYGKQWGAKVGETTIEIPNAHAYKAPVDFRIPTSVHSIDITPSMKKSVLYEGQPMFALRTPWDKDTSVVTVHTNLSKLKAHPDYEAAKTGDSLAAGRLADDLLNRTKINLLKAKLKGEKHVIIAPVTLFEEKGPNKIPLAMADVISHQTGWEIAEDIVQSNLTVHTDKDALGRLLSQPEFKGEVIPGATYVILDDVVTQGGTLANLKGYIESNGGKVKGIVTLAAAQFSSNLKVSPETLSKLRERYGQNLKDLLNWIYEENIHEENLTESEARTLLRQGETLDRRRNAEASGRSEGNPPGRPGIPGEEVREETAGITSEPGGKETPEFSLVSPPTSPNPLSETAKESPFDFLRKFNARYTLNISDKDLGKIRAFFGNPWDVAQKDSQFHRILDRQLARDEAREELLHRLLSNTIKDSPSKQHEFLALSPDQRNKLFKVMVWSDANNTILTKEEDLRTKARELGVGELTKEQVSAYYAWKRRMNEAWKMILDQAEKMIFKQFEGQLWFQELKVLAGKKKRGATEEEKKRYDAAEAKIAKLAGEEQKRFKLALERIDKPASRIRRMRMQMGRVKYYVPRVREKGKYVIRVYDQEDNLIHSERTNSTFKGKQIFDRLKARFPGFTVEKDIEKAIPESIFQTISDASIEKFIERAVDRVQKKEEIRPDDARILVNALFEAVTDQLKGRGFGEHMIRRREGKAVTGYETEDGAKVFMDYISGLAGFLTKQEAAFDFYKMLHEIPIKDKPELFQYANNYIRDMLRNTTDLERLSGKVRSIAFAYWLSGNLKSAAMQFSQNFITGIPFLGRQTKRPQKKYIQAMKDVAVDHLTEEERKALHEAINKGITTNQYVKEITNRVRGGFRGTVGKLVDLLAAPFSGMEIFNRKSAFLAMFRVARNEQKLSYEEALEKARDYVYETHYLYGKANLPSWARSGTTGGAIARTSYTFRSFTHNYLISMVRSLKSPDGKIALDVVARSLAYLVLFGGAAGLPFLDDLLDELEKILGIPFRTNMRKALKGLGGNMLEKFGMEGLPALIGVDLSGSLKVGLPKLSLKGTEETVYGVYGGLFNKGQKVLDAFSRDDILRAIESGSPAFIENLFKAYRMYEEGATTPTGKIIYDEEGKPIQLTAGEALGQAAGFRPERLAEAGMEKRVLSNIEEHYKDIRDDLYAKYRLARTEEERGKVLRDVERYNLEVMKYQGAIPRISRETLRRSFIQKPEKSFTRFEQMYAQQEAR